MPRAATDHGARIELAVDGMHCAACANRVESAIAGVPGAQGRVNLALESATVDYDPSVIGVDEILRAVEGAGYAARPGAVEIAAPAEDGLGARLAVALGAGVPVIAISMIPALQFDYWQWAALAAATVVVLWAGAPFLRGAWAGLRHRSANMDTLVSLGALTALIWSALAIVAFGAGGPDVRMSAGFDLRAGSDHPEIYLEVAVGIVALLLVGRRLERRARLRAGTALRDLLTATAPESTVLRADGEKRVPAAALTPGDRVVVRPGERLPVDGVVVEGHSALDVGLITGESLPEDVGVGDTVSGGAINLGGRIVVEARRVGADTLVAQMARAVADAQAAKGRYQRLADRVSAIFVPVVIVIAAATFVGWLVFGGSAAEAGTAAVSVLVIACPCALGLATPAALLAGTGRAAELGIVIRDPEALERAREIRTVALDKTGTLTEGRLALGRIVPAAGVDADDALTRAASLGAAGEHPVARALADAAASRALALAPVDDVSSTAGHGMSGILAGERLELRRGRLDDAAPTETLSELVVDGRVVATFALTDDLRAQAAPAVRSLNGLDMRVVVLSGDRPEVVRHVAASLGIDDARGGLDPLEKAGVLAELRRERGAVAMVGDGVNDAPALAEADLSVAIGHGADLAISTADITLTTSDPRAVADAIGISRRTRAVIIQNLVWAFGYNVLAIPLAVAGVLSPLIAAAAMAASSLLVVINSLRLRGIGGIAR